MILTNFNCIQCCFIIMIKITNPAVNIRKVIAFDGLIYFYAQIKYADSKSCLLENQISSLLPNVLMFVAIYFSFNQLLKNIIFCFMVKMHFQLVKICGQTNLFRLDLLLLSLYNTPRVSMKLRKSAIITILLWIFIQIIEKLKTLHLNMSNYFLHRIEFILYDSCIKNKLNRLNCNFRRFSIQLDFSFCLFQ